MRPRRCIGRKIFYALFTIAYVPALLVGLYGFLRYLGYNELATQSPQWSRPYLASLGLIGEAATTHKTVIRMDLVGTLTGPTFQSAELRTFEENGIHGYYIAQYRPSIPHGPHQVTIRYNPLNTTNDDLLAEIMRHEGWHTSPNLPPRSFILTAAGSFWNGDPVGDWFFRNEKEEEIGIAKIVESTIIFRWNTECKSSAAKTIRKTVEDTFTMLLFPKVEQRSQSPGETYWSSPWK